MDPLLKRMADDAAFRDNSRVREYLAILGEKGFPQKLVDALPRAEKALAAAQKLASRLQKDFPLSGNQDRPGWLRDAIAQLHNDFVQPALRGLYASLPQRLTAWTEKIKGAKAGDFKFYSAETLARCDINRADSLMGELARLQELPQRASESERAIKEWLSSPTGGGRYSVPPAPAFAPKALGDPDEGKQYDTFETRK